MLRIWLIFYICFASLTHSVYGQEQNALELEDIVITPTRTEGKVSSTASTVTVLSAKELEKRGLYTVKDALKEDFSIDIAQAGALGGSASIFIRGANSGQTRVMIDGVRVYDPISTNAAFDPAYLSLDNIEKIEIVKGPQSSLYGADAIGGVINIITKKGKGRPRFLLYEEAGTYYTRREGIDFSGEKDKLRFSISSSHLRSKGFSRAAKRLGNPERDPYENNAYSMRTDYDLSDELSLGLIGRYTYARYAYDDGGGAGQDDVNRKGWTKQGMASFVTNHKISDNSEQKIQLSWMGNYRRDFDENDPVDADDYLRDWYSGESLQAEWQGNYKLCDFDTIVAGFNYLKERGESYFFLSAFPPAAIFPKRYAWTKGYFLENRLNLNDRFTSTVSYRIEDHSRFNTHDTYRIDALYTFDKINTKVKGAFGTGFKTPTLYQLYAPADAFFGGGNVNLRPEESQTYEAGFEQPFFDNKFKYSLTYFHNNFKNLIDSVFNPVTFVSEQYRNVGKARSFGYENKVEFKPKDNLKISGNYTWLDTENKENHDELLRRAKNKFNLNLDYVLFEKWGLNFDVSYVGHRQDSGNLLLKRYVKADFATYYNLDEHIKIYARIENMFNKKYEEIKGYATAGFSVYGGVKAEF